MTVCCELFRTHEKSHFYEQVTSVKWFLFFSS